MLNRTQMLMCALLSAIAVVMSHAPALAGGGCLLTIPPDEVCSFLPEDVPVCCPPGYWLYCNPCTGEPVRCLPDDCEYPDCAFDCTPICALPFCDAVPTGPGCRNCDIACLPSCWVETQVAQACVGPNASRIYTFDFCTIDCELGLTVDWIVCGAGTTVPYTVLSPTSTGSTFCVQAFGDGELTVVALGHDGASCETYSVEERVNVDSSCPGDVDASGAVDVFDLNAVIAAWGPCPVNSPCDGACCAEDTDGNNAVDVFDLMTVLNAWGPCP